MKSFLSDYTRYSDTYFLKSLTILQKEMLNPYVRIQLFIRKGPGYIYGIKESLNAIQTYTQFIANGGQIFSLPEGSQYTSEETVMILEGKIQDIITLETMMLGIITSKTTERNDHIVPQPKDITHHIHSIVKLLNGRPVFYFGARHWSYDMDVLFSKAAFDGGATDVSTNQGAAVLGKKGIGTIPHALECIFAWKYGYDRAVVESLRAFDNTIDPSVPRIALVDFRNKEIDDAIACVHVLKDKLYGVRVDTCGENTMQGTYLINHHEKDPYWIGTGVNISGVYSLRKRLNQEHAQHLKIILSSGFGHIEKVKAFIAAEKELSIQLFDALGVGEVFPVRSVTMDIVGVGDTIESILPISKKGRGYKPNPRLKRIH